MNAATSPDSVSYLEEGLSEISPFITCSSESPSVAVLVNAGYTSQEQEQMNNPYRSSYLEDGRMMDLDTALLGDRMFDDLGRVLDYYKDSVAYPTVSNCATPRSNSPWVCFPSLTSSSSSSTLMSCDIPLCEVKRSKPQKKQKKEKLKQSIVQPQQKKKYTKKRSGIQAGMDEEGENEVIKPKKKKKTTSVDGIPLERSRKSSSTYRGVSLCTKDSRWQARIRIRKEVVYLGRFESEEAAARRYDEAAREHHGEKALINFITEEDRVLGRRCVFEQVGGKSARI